MDILRRAFYIGSHWEARTRFVRYCVSIGDEVPPKF